MIKNDVNFIFSLGKKYIIGMIVGSKILVIASLITTLVIPGDLVTIPQTQKKFSELKI